MNKTPLNTKNTHLKYLVVNEHDLLWGLTINSVGYQSIAPQSEYPLPNHPTRYLFTQQEGRILDEYQLLYISKGEGTFSSQSTKTVKLREGNMFLLFPGEWHNYRPLKEIGWDEYWIGFNGANIDNRVEQEFFSKQKPVFNLGISDEIVYLYTQAIAVAEEQKAGFQQMLAGIVNHLLGLVYSHDKNLLFEDTQVITKINKAKIIMIEHLFEGIKPETIADELNMSYSWFRRLFKTYTGFSPWNYMYELRMQKAKEILTNTNESIKEISFTLGFENPEYFFTAFKRKTNMTPTQYRAFTQGKWLK